MNVTEINSNNFSAEIATDLPVLIDFWASWCGPCKMLSPVVDEVASENKNIKVCKVNVDDCQDLATKFNIMSIPTLVVLKNGTEVKRSVGVISKQEIIDLI